MTPKPTGKGLRGGVLNPSAGIEQEYTTAVCAMVRRMADETRKVLSAVFAEASHDAMDSQAEGAIPGHSNISSQARIALNALMDKYETLFGRLARKATKRMIDRTARNSAITLGMSLSEMGAGLKIDAKQISPRLADIMTASTNQAASLIKLIPAKYLTDVQGAVMRSIVSGKGLTDLRPFLEKQYDGDVRHARFVAMDQTRKAYSNMTASRMKDVGVKEFEWLHVGGSKEPRQLHIDLSGKVFKLDDPPFIGRMYGEDVHGLPGDLPGCRCKMRPRVSFDDSDD